MSLTKVKQVSLDKLNEDFIAWQKATADIAKENNSLNVQIRTLQKQIQELRKILETLSECGNLKCMVDKLQSILAKRCDLEVENGQLKEQISTMKGNANNLEQEHKRQIIETIKNLEASDQAHKQEIIRVREEAVQQTKRELAVMEKTIYDKTNEVRQLLKQLSDLEREKQTELVKLRLEYDAKLLKLQKTNVSKPQGQNSNINSDIFRKKLQAAKAESEREIMNLKSKVAQLERKLATREEQPQQQYRGQQTFSLKRKRF